MGFVYVDLEIAASSDPDASETVRARVDENSMLSVFPANLLDGLGVRRFSRRMFYGFNGPVARDIGGVFMRCDDVVAYVTVVFGAEDDPPIMGVTALGSLGYKVDPVAGRLNRVEMLML